MVGRNNKGQFKKGHPDFVKQSGVKPGCKKTIAGEVKDALKIAEDAMPEIIQSMIDRAKGIVDCPVAVSQAAAEYLCDRIYGKANQPLEHKGNIGIEVDAREKLISLITYANARIGKAEDIKQPLGEGIHNTTLRLGESVGTPESTTTSG